MAVENSSPGKWSQRRKRRCLLADYRYLRNGPLFGPIGPTAAHVMRASNRSGAVDPIERESAPLVGLTGRFFLSGCLSYEPDCSYFSTIHRNPKRQRGAESASIFLACASGYQKQRNFKTFASGYRLAAAVPR